MTIMLDNMVEEVMVYELHHVGGHASSTITINVYGDSDIIWMHLLKSLVVVWHLNWWRRCSWRWILISDVFMNRDSPKTSGQFTITVTNDTKIKQRQRIFQLRVLGSCNYISWKDKEILLNSTEKIYLQ